MKNVKKNIYMICEKDNDKHGIITYGKLIPEWKRKKKKENNTSYR